MNNTSVVFFNGRVVTLDPANPLVEALVVSDGKIARAGSGEDCRKSVARPSQKIDLEGAWVLPGLTDSHIHFSMYAQGLTNVRLEDTTSLREALDLIREKVASSGQGEWVLGGRYDYNRWDMPQPPDKRSLDSVAPYNPVALSSRDGHTMWANSRALKLAGITETTPDPSGGKIVRFDGSREPSGLLQENGEDLMWRAIESAPRRPLTEAIKEAFPHALECGITSVHDFDREDAIAAYKQLHDSGELRIRVYKSIPADALEWAIQEGIRTGQGDEWFRFGPVKIFTDGALGSHTAALLEPYTGETDNYGIETIPPAELQEMMLRASSSGIACALHAIGDKANRNALDAFQRVRESEADRRLRHRIEHVQHLSPRDLPRLAELNVIASMQPIHATSDMYVADRLLAGRDIYSYAWNSLARTGAKLAFGSDCPVEPMNPFLGLHAAVTRQRGGKPEGGWQPHERLGPEETYRAFAEGAAWASGEEAIKGRLKAGMLADFILLPDNPLTCDPDKIERMRPLATYVGGVEAYRA